MIEVVIFDLDDTLIDTSGLIIPAASQKCCEILIKYGIRATLPELITLRSKLAQQMSHQQMFPHMMTVYGMDPSKQQGKTLEEIAQLAVNNFYRPDLRDPLPLIPGALENLKALYQHKPIYLVTSGIPEFQKKKLSFSHCEHFFDEVFFVDSYKKERKLGAFQEILKKHSFAPNFFLCVGNRLSSEIRDAKMLNMTTCHFEFGEHVGEVPEQPEDHPDFQIHHHKELLQVCPILL